MELELEQQKNQENEKINNNININEKNLENNQKVELLVDKEVTVENQNTFLQTTLGKTINTALDIGLRGILPEMLEEQIIDIKNVLLTNGLKEGIDTAIKSAIDLGKSALGIFTGKFDNLSQAHTAVKKGGIIDSISEVIDNVLGSATKNELISKSTGRLIKKGKNAILDTIATNIEEKFLQDMNSLEKVSKYISNWKNYYNIKDINGMEKEYKKLKKQMATVMELDSTIAEAKKIENIHNLIKNKGINYELSEEEKELINILK